MNKVLLGRNIIRLSLKSLSRAVVLLSTLLLFSALSEQSRAGDAGALGGGGGGTFRIACEPGDQLVGIDAMATHVIDFIAPVCGNRNKDPLSTYGRPSAGAQAGTLHKPRCPPDAVLTILHVFIDKTPLVSRVGFTCWNPKTHAVTNSLPDYGGESVNNRRFACPPGQVGVGIYGRAGTAIDQLGLMCENFQVAQGGGPADPSRPHPNVHFCTVERPSAVYDKPDGTKQPPDLQPGTQGVTLTEKQGASWYHLKWATRIGWVYSGPGYENAIKCP